DSSTLSAVLVGGPSHGSLALNADGSFTYTPAADFNGTDSFTYRASDGSLSSNVATVTITVRPVNDAPVAANDSYTTDEDTTLTVGASVIGTIDFSPSRTGDVAANTATGRVYAAAEDVPAIRVIDSATNAVIA